MASFICFQNGRLNRQTPVLKSVIRGGTMGIVRIFVLGMTFFLVALCPRIDSAFVVFAFGLSAYIGLWLFELFKRRDKS
jgi:hypothetical protein